MNAENEHYSDSKMEKKETAEPGIASIHDYLVYGLSIPERTLRSTAAVVGGAINESATLLVPQAFRDSKSYQTFVQQMLDVATRDVGGVRSEQDDEQTDVENYVARKTVGSFIDLAGMATLHLSPIVILAVVSDLAYGSNVYLGELSNQLKEEGVIAEDSTIDSAAELLKAIGKVSNDTASAFDTPPISVEGLKATIDGTRESLNSIDPAAVLPQAEIDKIWNDMMQIADQQNVGLIQLSSAMTMYALNNIETASEGALTTITVTGQLLDRHVLQHYWNGLEEISERGLYTIVAESSQPYVEAVWSNFSMQTETITEDIISGKMVGKIWNGLSSWLGQENDAAGGTPNSAEKDAENAD